MGKGDRRIRGTTDTSARAARRPRSPGRPAQPVALEAGASEAR